MGCGWGGTLQKPHGRAWMPRPSNRTNSLLIGLFRVLRWVARHHGAVLLMARLYVGQIIVDRLWLVHGGPANTGSVLLDAGTTRERSTTLYRWPSWIA